MKIRNPRNIALKKLLQRTPEGRKIISSLHLAGTEDSIDLLGKGFFKKVGKGLKKAGKVTGKITGRIAKVAAGIVGIPPGAIDALAKVDPTAKKSLMARLMQSKAGQQAAAIVQAAPGAGQQPASIFTNIKPVHMAAGAAGLVAIVFLLAPKKGKG